MLKRMVPRLRLSATAILLTPIGLGIAPMSIVAMAQQSQLPSCDLKSVNWDNCQGSRQYPNGVYVGEFRNGQPNGQGTFAYADGGKYVGELRDGMPNGQGTATYANGQKCVGEFQNGGLNGQGTATHPDGRKYVGEFRDNKFEGNGRHCHITEL